VHEPGETPVAPGGPLAETEVMEVRYPTGPADAEALLVDPRTGDLVIVTKSLTGASRVMTAPADALVDGAQLTLSVAGPLRVQLPPDPGSGLPATMVTGGDVSPDGSMALLRTYGSVLVFERGDDETLAEALLGEPCFAPQAEEEQGEAIAFTADGTAYVTASEGVNPTIHRVEIAAAPDSTTSTSTAPDVPSEERSTDHDGDSGIAKVLVVGGLLLLVAGAAALLWSRRARGAGSAG
jgi:hypothetical protein